MSVEFSQKTQVMINIRNYLMHTLTYSLFYQVWIHGGKIPICQTQTEKNDHWL